MTTGEKRPRNRAEKQETRQEKIRRYIGTTAICGVVSYGLVGLANYKGDVEDPLAPSSVAATSKMIGRDLGQTLGLIDCPGAPSDQEMHSIIANTEDIADAQIDRFTMAYELDLTLVPEKEVELTKLKINDTVRHYKGTDIWPGELTAIANDFMTKHYGIDYEYVAPNYPAEYPLMTDYAARLTKFIENVSMLPAELFNHPGLTRIVVNSGGIGENLAGEYGYLQRTIALDWANMDDARVLIHELQHAVDMRLCSPSQNNSEKVMDGINPPGTQYDTSATFANQYDSGTFASGYGMKSAEEDMAESGSSWAMTTNVHEITEGNINIIDQKRLAAAYWMNQMAPNLAEYINAVSSKHLYVPQP